MPSSNKLVYAFTPAVHPTSGRYIEPPQRGITLREHYAGLAFQGLLASGDGYADAAAVRAVEQADALIAALNMTQVSEKS